MIELKIKENSNSIRYSIELSGDSIVYNFHKSEYLDLYILNCFNDRIIQIWMYKQNCQSKKNIKNKLFVLE